MRRDLNLGEHRWLVVLRHLLFEIIMLVFMSFRVSTRSSHSLHGLALNFKSSNICAIKYEFAGLINLDCSILMLYKPP